MDKKISEIKREKSGGPEPFSSSDVDAAYAHVKAHVQRSVNNTRRFKRDYIGTGPDVENALNSYKASKDAQKHLKVLLHKTMHGSEKQFVKDMENIFANEAKDKKRKRSSEKKSLLNGGK